MQSLALQADGKILVGGSFTVLGGQVRNRLARLNTDGTLDVGFNPGASGPVFSLAVQADGEVLVGGQFNTLSGQARTNIARLRRKIEPEGAPRFIRTDPGVGYRFLAGSS